MRMYLDIHSLGVLILTTMATQVCIYHSMMSFVVCCLPFCLFVFCLSDLTVGDLSGTVTTIRASPLVTVAMEFDNLQSTLDLVSDRKCTVSNDITLLWYDIIVNSQKFDGSVF